MHDMMRLQNYRLFMSSGSDVPVSSYDGLKREKIVLTAKGNFFFFALEAQKLLFLSSIHVIVRI